MRTEIPFNEVMKNHKNWHEDVDYDVMNENYLKLKPIMNKMFFAKYPAHPQYFSLLFSHSDFADTLLQAMVDSKIRNLNKVWFEEFSKEQRNVLLSKGMYDLIPTLYGATAIIYMRNGDDFFVNMIL